MSIDRKGENEVRVCLLILALVLLASRSQSEPTLAPTLRIVTDTPQPTATKAIPTRTHQTIPSPETTPVEPTVDSAPLPSGTQPLPTITLVAQAPSPPLNTPGVYDDFDDPVYEGASVTQYALDYVLKVIISPLANRPQVDSHVKENTV